MARPKENNKEKAKDFKTAIKRILVYSKKFIPALILASVLAIFSAIGRLIGPGKIGEITDLIDPRIHDSFLWGDVVKIAITLLIIYAVSFLSTYVMNIILGRVAFKVSQNLRTDISRKIKKLPLSYLDNTPYGDVLSRINNDVDTISNTLMDSSATFISSIVMLVGSLVMMFVTNWIMALSAVLATILGFLLMVLIINKSQKYFIMQQENLGELNGLIEEDYSGQTVIKSYNAEKETQKKFDEVNNKLRVSSWKSQFTSGIMQPLMGFISDFGYVVVCIVGAILVLNDKIGFGVIVSFMIYARLFTNPLAQLAQTLSQLQRTAASAERVFEFLDEKELADESNKPAIKMDLKGNVEFKNVKFGYTKDKEIIHNFSAKINAGEKVALVGPTGAGKTTIVNLLMRFYELNGGDIEIDGVKISDLKREELHNMFSMVLQDTWIFNGTVRENLVYNKKGLTEEDIWSACTACGIDHFIKTLPHGLDTILNDNTTISAGQKQLFTIARAMLQNSPMLILDEATSNVDTRTEELIQVAMDKLMKDRTSFVIAHRLSTIKNANLILVLNNGDIIEQGTHEELLKQKGFYAKLYNSQFSEE